MLLSELKSIESPLRNLISKELPIRYAFLLSKITEDIDVELQRIEKFRVDLITKYGEKVEGNLIVPNKEISNFNTEYNELMKTEVDIKPVCLSLEDLENCDIRMSVGDVNILMKTGFIKE